jgi:hypothetical protein
MHNKHILTLLIFYTHAICTRKKKASHSLGHNTHHPPTRGFGLGQGLNNNREFDCLSQMMLRHVRLTSIGKNKCATLAYIKNQTPKDHELIGL